MISDSRSGRYVSTVKLCSVVVSCNSTVAVLSSWSLARFLPYFSWWFLPTHPQDSPTMQKKSLSRIYSRQTSTLMDWHTCTQLFRSFLCSEFSHSPAREREEKVSFLSPQQKLDYSADSPEVVLHVKKKNRERQMDGLWPRGPDFGQEFSDKQTSDVSRALQQPTMNSGSTYVRETHRRGVDRIELRLIC